MSIAWTSNFSEPLVVSYLSTAGLNPSEIEYYQVHGLVGMDGVQVSAPSDSSQYSIDDSPWGYPPIWGPNWDDPPTYNSTFANYTSPWIHNTTIVNLAPDTAYLYQIGEFPVVFNFTSGLPAGSFPQASPGGGGSVAGARHSSSDGSSSSASGDSDSSSEPFVFSVVGDLGQTADSVLTRDHMIADEHSRFSLIIGDISYSDCDQRRWDSSGVMLESLAAKRPLMVGPGNHEIEYFPKTQRSFQAYEARFFMPDAGPPVGMQGEGHFTPNHADDDGGVNNGEASCTPSKYTGDYAFGNAFWSMDVGPVHVVSLNCYGPVGVDSDQYRWLEIDLLAVDSAATPFIVVMTHCPFYSSNKNHYEEWQATDMQATFEPLLYSFGVDLVLNGHVHAYQRSYPVYQGTPFPESESYSGNAPVYVVVGEGGNREGHAKGYVTPAPAWSAYTNDTSFGHGTVTVYNRTHMQWKWHVNAEPSWATQDSAWIVKKNEGGGDDDIPDPVFPTDDAGNGGDDDSNDDAWVTANTTWLTVLLFVLAAAILFGLYVVARKLGYLTSDDGAGSGHGSGKEVETRGSSVSNPIMGQQQHEEEGGGGAAPPGHYYEPQPAAGVAAGGGGVALPPSDDDEGEMMIQKAQGRAVGGSSSSGVSSGGGVSGGHSYNADDSSGFGYDIVGSFPGAVGEDLETSLLSGRDRHDAEKAESSGVHS